MVHKNRTWRVTVVPTAERLAELLTEYDWTGCTGFSVEGRPDVVFLNDGPPGEYAVCKREAAGLRQFESITFGWCNQAKALFYIEACLAGKLDDGSGEHRQYDLNHPEAGNSCLLCA